MAGKVLTASRVEDGEVVFLIAPDAWSPAIDEALVAETEAERRLLDEELVRTEAGTTVTDAYLFDAERSGASVRPLHIRERIRTLGPTVRPDLGKQSEGVGGAFAAVD